MLIVTARNDDAADGCLVGFSTQCSIDPVRFLVCLSNANRTYDIARRAPALVVHALRDAPLDRELAQLFGEETSFDVDKLARCEWEDGPCGAPVLRGLDWFSGRVLDQLDLGDHTGFMLAVGTTGHAARVRERPLTYVDVRDLEPGNPP
jgi:flavin reductase (DIM6/NTAB) family NADH-FMN oxidoreductase RutF